MSKLIARATFPSQQDELVTAFEGLASETLGAALDYFTKSAKEHLQKLRQTDNIPACILEAADRSAASEYPHHYHILPLKTGGYTILISNGPERYDLID